MKQVIFKEDVAKAIAGLKVQGKKITTDAVFAALGNRGSKTTLTRLMAEIVAEDSQPAATCPEAQDAFKHLWESAVKEGQKRMENIVQQTKEALTALISENQRLEGELIAANERILQIEAEAQQCKDDLKKALDDTVKARAQAADAFQRFADSQSASTEKMSKLQGDLAAAIQKQHETELQKSETEKQFLRAQLESQIPK